MTVAWGSTALVHGSNLGGHDGIASYVLRLQSSLSDVPDVLLRPFEFSRNSATEGKKNWGPFTAQAAWSLVTGRPFYNAQASVLRLKPDVVHATDHLILRLEGIPVVATLFDAIPLSHPQTLRSPVGQLKAGLWRRTAGWATEVITISEHSKREIVKWFGISEEKITVTPLGVDDAWYQAVTNEKNLEVANKYDLPERFFFFVGTLQPRKNIRRIIDAHKTLPPALRRECPLVIAGRHGWKCEAEVKELRSCQDGTLRWLQYVPSEDLAPIFKQATALVWPSLNEGFGLPVVEAFAAGLPVVTSNTTSLPEVAGDAALLVNPENTGEIADAMRQMATNDAMRSDLRVRGLARAKQFTWDRTARQTIGVYRKAIESFA
jgi:glycosyltransferase involved in cell wall biosynthesis